VSVGLVSDRFKPTLTKPNLALNAPPLAARPRGNATMQETPKWQRSNARDADPTQKVRCTAGTQPPPQYVHPTKKNEKKQILNKEAGKTQLSP